MTPDTPPTSPAERSRPARGGGGPADLGPALESFRVAATIAVLLYHASLAYLATPLRLTLWAVRDPAHAWFFDTLAAWVNGFAMPLFFLAAGVSAPAACGSRGVKVFLAQRARRLLKPLAFAAVTILPLTYLIWGYGLLASGRCELSHIVRWQFPEAIQPYLYGVAHLWFLEYLFLTCVLWAGLWWVGRTGIGQRLTLRPEWSDRLMGSWLLPWVLALPTAAIFAIDSGTISRINNSLLPNPSRVVHYTYFFAVGAWIGGRREARAGLARHARLNAGLSLAAFAVVLPLLLDHAIAPLLGWRSVAVGVLSALFSWFTLLGGLGLLLRWAVGRGKTVRYLAEASFWIYLIHVPVVAFLQEAVMGFSWPAGGKFLLVAASGLALSVLSYEILARYSLLGEIINGARKRLATRRRIHPDLLWIATLAAVVLAIGGGVWSMRSAFWGDNFDEAITGAVFRSARLSPRVLDEAIRDHRLRSVVTFTGGADRHAWFLDQQTLCERRGVTIRAIIMNPEKPPMPRVLANLVGVLDASPRPLLAEGHRGGKEVAFAAAVADVLDGTSPRNALRHFDFRHGDFGGPEHSPLAAVLIAYDGWLLDHHESHTPARFRHWVAEVYPAPQALAARPGASPR